MAVTGSDPYFVTGTDLAILFETDEPGKLVDFLRERLEAACRASSAGIAPTEGAKDGSTFLFARTPGREISAYIAALDRAVVLTNSPVQLERVLQTARNRSSRLVEAPEYRFFRSRYPRGADGETALLILTDATIRRWCGPQWRIASSRRVRAAAALAELQAANLAAIVAGTGALATDPCPTATLVIGSRPGRAAYLSIGRCFVTLRHARHSSRRSLRFPWTR